MRVLKRVDVNVAEVQSVLDAHGLSDWSVKVTRSKRTLGLCDCSSKCIHVSKYQPEGDLMDTVLHEVAHALTPGDDHGLRWRAKCREIGARPDRSVEARVHPSIAYQYECSCCGKKVMSISKIRKLILYVSKCCKAPLIFQKGPEDASKGSKSNEESTCSAAAVEA
jgi:hypothetical protein